jgi:hypothetical protein
MHKVIIKAEARIFIEICLPVVKWICVPNSVYLLRRRL